MSFIILIKLDAAYNCNKQSDMMLTMMTYSIIINM